MNKELEKTIVEKHPEFFVEYGGDPRRSAMAWGFECGDGWYNLIEKLCKDLQKEIDKTKEGELVVLQVKQKFGGLRFYYATNGLRNSPIRKAEGLFREFMFKHRWGKMYWKLTGLRQKVFRFTDEKVSDLVSDAEYMSYKICETCGKPGTSTGGGWVRVLCDECKNDTKR